VDDGLKDDEDFEDSNESQFPQPFTLKFKNETLENQY